MTVCVVHGDHEADEGWLVCRRAWGRLAGSLRQMPGLCDELEDQGYGQWDARDRRPYVGLERHGTARAAGKSGTNGAPAPGESGAEHARVPVWADPIAAALPAGPLKGAWRQSRIRSTRPERLVIAVDPTDLLMPARAGSVGVRTRGDWSRVPDGDPDQIGHLSVPTVLDSWVRDWAELRGENLPQLRNRVAGDDAVSILCSWLLDRLDWACQHHYALDEFAGDVQKLSSALYGLAGYGAARPKLMEAPCPRCHLLTLTQCYEEANIECSATDCGRILTPDEYAEHVATLIEENTP